MVICPDCRKDVPKAKFCKNCGAYIEKIEEVKPDFEEIPLSDETQNTLPVKIQDAAPVPTQENFKFCFNCGYELTGDFKFCPECGQDLTSKVIKSSNEVSLNGKKNIILAIILSAFLPGLGQIYLGLDHKGAIFLIAYIISAILILLFIGLLLCIIIWIWALVDTITSTNALNRGEEVVDKLL